MATPVVTTVILIRHADRDVTAETNPSLNAAGKARAKKLVHVLSQVKISGIFTSTFKRTKETAAPLALQRGITTTAIDDEAAIKSQILTLHKGKTVLVVGHANTVPALIDLLGGGTFPVINDSEFDNLFVVTIYAANKASTVHLKYGEMS